MEPLPSDTAVFSSKFKEGSADTVAKGAIFVSVFALVGFGPTLIGFAVFFLCLGIAVYHFPSLLPKRAQLRIDKSGIFLEGLGLIPWSAVAHISVSETFVRTMKFDRVVIDLEASISKVVKRFDAPYPLRGLMIKCFLTPSDTQISIRTELLSDKVEEIEAAALKFNQAHLIED